MTASGATHSSVIRTDQRSQKYDAAGRIVERCYGYPSNFLGTRCYTAVYDAAGNPTKLTDPDGTDVLEYDALNRLTKLTRTDTKQQTTVEDYAYNALGALKKNAGTQLDDQRPVLVGNAKADAGVPATFANQPVTLDGSGRITKFKGATLKYNQRGRLTRVVKPIQNGTESEVYGHDSAMRRIYRTRFTDDNNGHTVKLDEYYLYEGPNLIGVVDAANKPSFTFRYAGVDHPLRVSVTQGPYQGTRFYYELDLAGNVRRLITEASFNAVDVAGYHFTAFGIDDGNASPPVVPPNPPVFQPLGWKGRPFNDFSSLYDMRARQWSPALGVFTVIDEYTYLDQRSTVWGWPSQNPVSFSDPSGRSASLDPNDWDDASQQYFLSGAS